MLKPTLWNVLGAFCLGTLSVVVSVAAQSSQPGPGQQAPPPARTGLIFGRVVDGVGGRPVAGVMVQLRAGSTPGADGTATWRVMTSSDGYFVFHDLTKGSYTISASRAGYVGGAFGKRSIAGTGQPLELAEGERRSDVTIPMWRYASVSGTITDEAGEPIIGIKVRLLRRTIVAGTWQLTPGLSQPETDDRGAYRFGQLLPGEYIVGVGSTITTVPTTAQDAYAGGVASGAISPYQAGLDAGAGAPLASPGGVRVGPFSIKPPANGSLVRVSSTADGPIFVYPSVYHPAAILPSQAGIITLAPGDEHTNVDFQLTAVTAVRVSGTIVGPEGPSANTEVHLLAVGTASLSREASYETAIAVSDARGAFTFLGVTPGQYTIKVLRVPARAEPDSGQRAATVVQVGGSTIASVVPGAPPAISAGPTLSAAVPVSVAERNISGLSIALQPGGRISGRVEFAGSAPRPTADQVRRLFVDIDPADGRIVGPASVYNQIHLAQVDPDGQVYTYQLPPGPYVVRGGTVPGWTFASAMLNGKDVSDIPFDLGASDVSGLVLRYTDRPSDLSGTVREGNTPTGAGQVLLFPADSRMWTGYGSTSRRLRSATPGKDGVFRITTVPSGEYWVVAVPDEATTNWQDPASLRRLQALATSVTIAEGEKKVQDLTLRGAK